MIPGGLAGWAIAFAAVAGLALVRPDTRAAIGWTLLATAFPGAWLTAWKIGPALADRLGGEAVAAGVVAAVGYAGIAWIARVLATASEEEVAPRPPVERVVPAPAPPPIPKIQPAAGGVAAGAFAGSGAVVERDGLIRVLKLGPDFQTTAAAKGLAVSWAGTSDPATVDAFIDVLRDPGVTEATRIAVYTALLRVIGEAPDWDAEQRLQAAGLAGIDWARVDALDHALHDPEAPVPTR